MTGINTENTPKRGYIWQCAIAADKEIYSTSQKVPCGKWNAYFGRKWATGKRDAKWQGVCNCSDTQTRKRQLNLGNIWPEAPHYYETKEAAIEAAADMNSQQEQVQARRNQEDDGRFL